jgi:hypothetical protein
MWKRLFPRRDAAVMKWVINHVCSYCFKPRLLGQPWCLIKQGKRDSTLGQMPPYILRMRTVEPYNFFYIWRDHIHVWFTLLVFLAFWGFGIEIMRTGVQGSNRVKERRKRHQVRSELAHLWHISRVLVEQWPIPKLRCCRFMGTNSEPCFGSRAQTHLILRTVR